MALPLASHITHCAKSLCLSHGSRRTSRRESRNVVKVPLSCVTARSQVEDQSHKATSDKKCAITSNLKDMET